MSQAEILRLLRDQPFRPFRLQLTDGISYEIRHPDMAIVTPAAVYVGIPAPNTQGPATDIVMVSMRHIIQLEYLNPPGAATTTSSSNNP
jgi:hypothetical protein